MDWVVAIDSAIVLNRTIDVEADDYADYDVFQTVNIFSELPAEPVPNGYYQVLLRENSDPAGYYQYVNGAFTRVPPPADPDASFDLTTMPHRFIYDRDALTITYDTIPFTSRTSGTSLTNLILPIVGKKLKSVNYFQSRLVLLGEDSINTSFSSDIFNLYVNDVNDIVVQDRISKDILETNIGSPLRTIIIGNSVLITCENAVLCLDASFGNDNLTSANAALRKIADMKCQDIRPTSNGFRILVPDVFNELKVFAVADSRIGVQLIGSLNDYVPDLLAGITIRNIFLNENTAYVIGSLGELFLHDSRVEQGQYVQLAWTEYTTRTHSFIAVDSWGQTIRFLTQTSSDSETPYAFLEYVHRKPVDDALMTTATDQDINFKARLDIRETQFGSYNPKTDETSFVHTLDDASTDYSYVVNSETGAWQKCKRADGNIAYFDGDLSATYYFLRI